MNETNPTATKIWNTLLRLTNLVPLRSQIMIVLTQS